MHNVLICCMHLRKEYTWGPRYWNVPVLMNTGTFLVSQYCLKMWYLRSLEHAGVIQKLSILDRKNGLVLSNTRVPVSGLEVYFFRIFSSSWYSHNRWANHKQGWFIRIVRSHRFYWYPDIHTQGNAILKWFDLKKKYQNWTTRQTNFPCKISTMVAWSTMVNHGKLCCNHALTMINSRFVKWQLNSTMVESIVDHGYRFVKWHHGSTMVEPCCFCLILWGWYFTQSWKTGWKNV